jgi:Helix-turn-helix.
MRELARRCGVSAGQLSRIESGDVGQPEVETVRSVAQALGVPTVPLLVISGHLGQQDLEQFVDEREGLFDTEDLGFIIRGETSNLEHDRTLGPLDAASIIIERWNPRALSRELGLDEDPAQHQVDEVAAAWPGLTEDRRRMVLAFVADQEVLSRLERMPNPPGRYLPSVTLNPTAADDA